MNEFDTIINSKSNDKVDKKAELFELIETTVPELMLDSKKFQDYLNVQSVFDKYTINNAILISAQMPTATKIKPGNEWESAELGHFLKDNPKKIFILKPGDKYINSKGEHKVTYKAELYYDISQTNIDLDQNGKNYDHKVIFESLLTDCPAKLKATDSLPDNKSSDYNKEENTITLLRGLEYPEIFHAITKELAKSHFESSSSKEMEEFKAQCVSYMVCRKLGIDVSEYQFNKFPQEFNNMKVDAIKKELNTIHDVQGEMNSRVNSFFYKMEKDSKNKELER